MRTRVKWTEEELQTFYDLLKDHCVKDAAKIHAENTGREVIAILSMFYRKKSNGSIPKNILDNSSTIIHWTHKEEKELLNLVEKYPHCLKEAFRIHASNTGRGIKAVQEHFYRLRRLEDTKVCMATIGGRTKCSPNRKNIYPGTGGTIEPVKKSIWKKILSLLFG